MGVIPLTNIGAGRLRSERGSDGVTKEQENEHSGRLNEQADEDILKETGTLEYELDEKIEDE